MAPMELTRMAAGASSAAAALVSAAWEGLVLAGVVAVCLRMLPGITAAARSVVWTVVMLVVCGLPFVRFGGASTGGVAGPQVHLDEWVGLGLVAVWAVISLVRAGQLVRSAVWLRGISRRALPVGDCAGNGNYGDLTGTALRNGSLTSSDEVASGSARMTVEVGMTAVAGVTAVGRRAAELCVSDEVDRPCVVGFFKPRVLVPTALFEEISDGELQQIVMHEMEHLRRRDDWTNLLQKLSLVVFPLNPALIWIERQLCVERELACDDRVLKATGARKAYAACLANLAEHSVVRRGVSLALGAWERQSEVVRRVHRILSRNEREMGRRQVVGVVAVLMAGVLAGADGLAHAPALVSFGPSMASRGQANMSPQEAFPQGLKPTFMRASYGGTEVPPLQSDRALRATMVKAVVPIRTATLRAKREAAVEKVTIPMVDSVKRASNVGHPSEIRQPDEPMVVMVTWQMASPVIVQDSNFTYAAVPTRNGWLFVQL